MTIKKKIIALLDRRGLRPLLGKLATSYARTQSGADVEVYYDGLWMHRVGKQFFPHGPRFTYNRDTLAALKDQPDRYRNDAHDFWFQHSMPQKGGVIVDVGAGRGEDAMAFSQAVGETGRVIAIEAHPLSFQILKRYCELNGLSNVTCLHLAAMDQPGTVTIEDAEIWEETAVGKGAATNGTVVRATTLDEICEKEGVKDISLLKINIEGAERYALPGMERTLPFVRTICVSCHDFRSERGDGENFRTRAFTEKFLNDRGFQLASRPDDSRDYVRDHVFGLRDTAVRKSMTG